MLDRPTNVARAPAAKLDDRGFSIVEYALLVIGVAALIVLVAAALDLR